MKKSLPLIALIAALAAGSASAGGTLAGTSIVNEATATYADPSGNPQPEVRSNKVTTQVQEVPGFVVKIGGQDSTGTPGPNGFTAAASTSAKPGDTVSFKYTLTNTGNVADTYALTTPAAGQTGAPYAFKTDGSADSLPTSIRFFPVSADTNGDGVLSSAEISAATASGGVGTITSLTNVPADDPTTTGDDGSAVNFFVVYNVPIADQDGTKIGTSPVVTGAKATTPDSNNYNQTTVSRTDSGLIGPFKDANANGNVDPFFTSQTNLAVTPYNSPEGKQITYSGNSQSVTMGYSASAQTVTFTNTVLNTGNRDDVFNITVPTSAELDAQGFPANTTISLFLVDKDGLNPVALTDTNNDGILDVGTLAPSAAANIRVQVTLPAGARPDAPGTIPSIAVMSSSSNTTGNKTSTTDKVLLSGADFGDYTSAAGTSSAPAVPVTGNPGDTVYLPMDVYNAGNTSDSFNLSGSVVLPLTAGGPQTVPVVYYVDTDGDGTLSAGEKAAGAVTSTGSIAPGAEVHLIGAITIPASAASTASGIAVTQTATSPTTGATSSDNNDTVKVGTTGVLELKKFVDNCTKTNVCPAAPLFAENTGTHNDPVKVAPAEVLRYTVIAKNNTNNVVRILSLKDSLPANTTFVSVSGSSTVSGTIYYRVNGGTWVTTAPTALTTGQSIEVAIDTNATAGIDSGDTIPVGGELRMDFRVKVN